MRIYFSRYQEQRRKYVVGFWAAILIGGLAAVTANPTGFGLGAFLLTVAFVALCGFMAMQVSDDYGDEDFRSRELSGDEYLALDSRLQTYPELKEKIAEALSEEDRITYGKAYEIERIVNAHADKVKAAEDEAAQQTNRKALFESVSKK